MSHCFRLRYLLCKLELGNGACFLLQAVCVVQYKMVNSPLCQMGFYDF